MLSYEWARAAGDVKEMGVKTFYTGECIGASKRATVMLEGLENFYIKLSLVLKQSLLLEPLVIFMKEKSRKMDKQLSKLLIFSCRSFSWIHIWNHRYWMFFAVRAYIYILLPIFRINYFFKMSPFWKMKKIFLCSVHAKNTATQK